MDVSEAIDKMAALVKRGEFTEAAAIGASAAYPLAIDKSSLTINNTIYEGGQAIVYNAQLATSAIPIDSRPRSLFSNLTTEESIPVALKKARIRESADLERFREEIRLLAELAPHTGFVSLIGARLLPPDYSVVLGLEATNVAHQLYETNWNPGWAGAIRLGQQVASALAHLHSHNVVHRDIKPANILLSADLKTAKLADLGIAARLPRGQSEQDLTRAAGLKPTGGFHKQHLVGTLEYMGPEILMKQPFSTASDVFALAVAVNEIASNGQFPYSDCTRDNPLAHTILEMGYGRQELATAVAAEGLRPTIAPDAPAGVASLLRACWSAIPSNRPTAAQVAEVFESLLSSGMVVDDDGSNRVQLPITSSNNKTTTSLDTTRLFLGLVDNPSWISSSSSADHQALAGSFASAGLRGQDKMEDRCLIVRDFNGIKDCMLVAVFDGHRGYQASDYLSSTFERHLLARWSTSSSASDALRSALIDADEAFRAQHAHASMLSNPNAGSTATVALLYNGTRLAVANIGDSRAVISRRGTVTDITIDQTAEREDERQRIEASGGYASIRLGQWRVGDAGMQVTRSIGDADLKSQGVIAEPETYQLELVSGVDDYLILATDGLWEKLNGVDALEVVQDTVKQPAMCAQRLVMEALARGSQDNVTCIVCVLHPDVTMAERVYHGGKQKYGLTSGAKRVAARMVEDEMRDTY